MPKFIVSEHGGEQWVRYRCPGCGHDHAVPAARWNWNGDVDKPTLSPSVRHYYEMPADVAKKKGRSKNRQVTTCHYHIEDGMIKFCNDCPHKLKNQTVELPEIEEVSHDTPTD